VLPSHPGYDPTSLTTVSGANPVVLHGLGRRLCLHELSERVSSGTSTINPTWFVFAW
jgi:hypothetical protein